MSVRYIPIIEIEITQPLAISIAANSGMEVRYKEKEEEGEERRTMVMDTVDWLAGDNPWALHNDMHFANPRPKRRVRKRIEEAAWKAKEEGKSHIPIAEGDYEDIKVVVARPQPHPNAFPMPPAIGTAVEDILEAIEQATTTVPKELQAEKPKDNCPEKPE